MDMVRACLAGQYVHFYAYLALDMNMNRPTSRRFANGTCVECDEVIWAVFDISFFSTCL